MQSMQSLFPVHTKWINVSIAHVLNSICTSTPKGTTNDFYSTTLDTTKRPAVLEHLHKTVI